jgi:outer membrane immunogenic protein
MIWDQVINWFDHSERGSGGVGYLGLFRRTTRNVRLSPGFTEPNRGGVVVRTLSASMFIIAVMSPATALSQAPSAAWSGFSAGAAGGIAFGNAHSDISGRIETSSAFGSLYAQYNFQLSNGLVLGLASGISPLPGLFGNASRPCPAALCQGLQAVSEFHTEVNWFADIRFRAGYAMGQFLPYMTAGFGFGEGRSSATTSVSDHPVSELVINSNLRGGVFGVGLQYALTPHIAVDTLYLRVQASANRVPNGSIGTNALRVGLDYRF